MGENSAIAWCDNTQNFWIGCEKVSEACKYCYAEVDTYARVSRSRGLELWGKDAARHRTSAENWKKPARWNNAARNDRERAQIALGMSTIIKRPRVFTNSLSDFFEDRRDLDPWRADAFKIIEECTDLDWLILTKRPQHVLDLVPASWRYRFPANVWMGTTAETQARADERIPHLLGIPAVVRFVSIEPQIERISLARYMWPVHERWPAGYDSPDAARAAGKTVTKHRQALVSAYARFVDWCIVGGESGSHARPFDLAWARSLRDECKAAGVAYLCKQLGAHVRWDGIKLPEDRSWPQGIKMTDDLHVCDGLGWSVTLRDRAGADPSEWPEDLRVQQFPEARTQ